MQTYTNIMFLVYGGDKEIPLFVSSDINKCLKYMQEGGLSTLACYTIKAIEKDKY